MKHDIWKELVVYAVYNIIVKLRITGLDIYVAMVSITLIVHT